MAKYRMAKYRPVRKAMVLITKDLKKVFYGMRALYYKDYTGKVYIKYKNRYYRAYYTGHYNIYQVRL